MHHVDLLIGGNTVVNKGLSDNRILARETYTLRKLDYAKFLRTFNIKSLNTCRTHMGIP